MTNVNHLSIDKPLKKELNNQLKIFKKFRVSEGSIKSSTKKKSNFMGFLFKEYDSINDMVKDLF